MMNAKIQAAWFVIRKFALPVVFGGLIGWLTANGYNEWREPSCGIAGALGVVVEECN
jgi:hypothetical protein